MTAPLCERFSCDQPAAFRVRVDFYGHRSDTEHLLCAEHTEATKAWGLTNRHVRACYVDPIRKAQVGA